MILVNNALIRYALPVFPWLAICAAMNINLLFEYLSLNPSRPKIAFLLIIGFIYLFSTRLPLIVRLYDNLPQRIPLNYYLGRESKENYLSRNLAVYDAYKFIDSQKNGIHRVLSIGNEFRLYTDSRIDGIYDVFEAHRIVSSAENYDSLAISLESAGYDYILVNQPEIDFRPWKYSIPYPILQNDIFLNLFGELVYAEKGIYVYHLIFGGVALPTSKNLIHNQSFKSIEENNNFDNWRKEGEVGVSSKAYKGDHALLLYAPTSSIKNGYVYQQVRVEEGQFYTLGYWINSDQPATFLMQIRWLDEYGNLINAEEYWRNVIPGWYWYTLHCKAPKKASFANVIASLGGDENVIVDEVCLAEGQRCPNGP